MSSATGSDDFWPEPEDEKQYDYLRRDHWRTCGWCEQEYWYEFGGVLVTGMAICPACGRREAEKLREREARWRAKQAAKKAVLADETGLADALISGNPSKPAGSKAKKVDDSALQGAQRALL